MDILYTLGIGVQYVAIVILVIELIYVLCQRNSETQKYVIVLLISTMLMFIGYLIEIKSTSMSEAIAGVLLSYIGKPFIMLFTVLALASYYGMKISRPVFIAAFIYSALFTVAVYTNDFHHLFYSTVNFSCNMKYSPLVHGHGILYYLYVVTTFVYACISLFIIIKDRRQMSSGGSRELKAYSIAMVVSGFGGYAIYLSGLTGEYDFTIIGMFFSVIFLFLIFASCRIFDLITLAKDHAIDNSSTALFVYDSNKKLTYRNKLAAELSNNPNLMKIVETSNRGMRNYYSPDTSYSVFRNVMESNGSYLGESVELTDITDAHNYQVRLEKQIKARTEQLENIQRNIIGSIASIVEGRSVETGEHIIRTGEYTRIIAEALRNKGLYSGILTDAYIDLLVSASPLHDIGKISVPDAILMSPRKLSDSEFEIIKSHSANGAKIIENCLKNLETDEYIHIAVDIALYHHEWWNGNGYPFGLKGDEIPLCARIVALSDTFDALRSSRCYKEAYSFEKSIEIIKEESGTHFEPAIAEAFIEALTSPDRMQTE